MAKMVLMVNNVDMETLTGEQKKNLIKILRNFKLVEILGVHTQNSNSFVIIFIYTLLYKIILIDPFSRPNY